MRLEINQIERIIHRLSELSNPPRPCSICGHNQWNVSDTVFEVREFHEGNMVLGGDSRIIPFVAISCQNCGNTLFINAIQMGIIEPNQPQTQSNNEGR